MNEQNSEKDTPEKNEPAWRVTDGDEKVNDAEKEGRAGQRNSGQADHYIIWGLPWPQFVAATLALLGVIATIIMTSVTVYLRWQADMISQDLMRQSQGLIKQKERPRVVLSDMQIEPVSDPDLFFSLIFKNVGETTALNTYGAWLQGECQRTSSQECVDWCLQPLQKTQGKSYGPLDSQDKYTQEFSYTLKIGKARKKQRPVYFCGYFAYTDVFCVWRRQFYVLSYDLPTRNLSTHTLTNDEEQAQAQNCRP